jgi:hypothetical protein
MSYAFLQYDGSFPSKGHLSLKQTFCCFGYIAYSSLGNENNFYVWGIYTVFSSYKYESSMKNLTLISNIHGKNLFLMNKQATEKEMKACNIH